VRQGLSAFNRQIKIKRIEKHHLTRRKKSSFGKNDSLMLPWGSSQRTAIFIYLATTTFMLLSASSAADPGITINITKHPNLVIQSMEDLSFSRSIFASSLRQPKITKGLKKTKKKTFP